MPRFNNLAELDFYIKDIPAHALDTWEANEIEMPSDVDLENEAMILYAIEHIIQDSKNYIQTTDEGIRPFNFHLLEPQNENDLDTCFMSKVVYHGFTDDVNMIYNEGNVTPMVPIIILTSFWESATVQGLAITASDEAFRIWYDDVPLTQSKMATLVNILRGEQL